MKVTVHSSKAVKPDYASCGVAPAGQHTADAVPLTVFDKAIFGIYISVIYAFRPPAPPNAVLEAGLARALVHYREWAGRLDLGVDAILLNDAGARFVEAEADVSLDSVMPLGPTPEVLSLHPSGDDGTQELMLIQVTRFACGSLVVGFTAHHIVSDGRASCNFFLAWRQATRGVAVEPVPVHDRVSFFKPRDPPNVEYEYEHRGAEFKHYEEKKVDKKCHASDGDVVVVNTVHFSLEFISKLKSQASAGAHQPYSTLQCLVAHLWRCVTKARGLDGSVSTSVAIAVDGRARMSPPVPDGYTGNVVLRARPAAKVLDLVTRPLQHAVELIKREVARIDGRYFESFIDFASSGAVDKERLVPAGDAAAMVQSPNIEVGSWLRIPFYDLDFGAGQPFFFAPSYLPVEGLLLLLPSYLGDGSVDAYVPLFSRHMHAFENCFYALD